MELTNYSFLQSRNDYMSTIAERKITADRIATGKRLENAGEDVGAIHQAAYQETELRVDRQSIVNLKNLRSFLFAQENSLKRVHEMYDKMEILAIKSANPMTSQTDREDYEIEYKAYQKQLDEIMKSRYNGKLLFSSTEMCGSPADVAMEALDASNSFRRFHNQGGAETVRAQVVETGSPSGTMSFRVNSGTAGDTYRVWMGDICVFSAGPAFNGSTAELYEELPSGEFIGKNFNTHKWDNDTDRNNEAVTGPFSYNYEKDTIVIEKGEPKTVTKTVTVTADKPNFTYSGNGWRTHKSASTGDDDLFEVTFGPGVQTTYKVTLGASNDQDGDGVSDYNPYDAGTGLYTNVITNDLPDDFDRTEMTLQLETNTIGVIYEKYDAANGVDDDFTQHWESGQLLVDTAGRPMNSKHQVLNGTQAIDPATGLPKTETKRLGGADRILPVMTGLQDQISDSAAEFVPTPFIRYIPKDRHGNNIELKPKGFDRFEDSDFSSAVNARDAVDKMRGNEAKEYFGEMKCIVENRIGSLGSEYKRVDSEIRALENQITHGEMALGRITDADMAKEATELARNNLQSELATQVMANSSRLKDVLIPLTTDHFRGAALSASL